MPDSIRNGTYTLWVAVISGLTLIAITTWLTAYSKGYQSADHDHQTDYANHQASQKAQQECLKRPTIKEALSCYQDTENNSRDKQRAEQDLDAQREMANWAEAILWATLFVGITTIIVTVIGVYWVRETLITAREMNSITRNAFTLEKRAWMEIVPFSTGEIRISQKHINVQIEPRFRNVGRLPAQNVSVSFVIDSVGTFKSRTGTADSHKFERPGIGDGFKEVIFPNGLTSMSPSASASFSDDPITSNNVWITAKVLCHYTDGTSGNVRINSETITIIVKNPDITTIPITVPFNDLLVSAIPYNRMIT